MRKKQSQQTKKIFLIFSILSFVLITSSFSCRKEQSNVLPPETQTGANTFGCLIDGQLFLGYTTSLYSSLRAIYDPVTDELSVGAYGKINGNMAGYVGMRINHPVQNSIQTSATMGYTPNSGTCTEYENLTNERIYITKFDTTNKIVSGQFQFVGYCGGDSTNTKQITEGRFDIQLYIYTFN